jgi:hypothetical protein
MSTWMKVARFHSGDWFSYLALPWGVMVFSWVVWLALAGSYGGGGAQVPCYNLCTIYLVFLIVGSRSIFGALPFAMALGVSRRSFYAGTTLLAIGLAVVYGLALALLQLAERASGGWGVGLHFYRVVYIMDGPWYLTWLTSSVGLALVFFYGMWIGLVYRRWNLLGVFAFAAAQVTAAVAVVIIVSDSHAWSSVGRFFTALSAAGLTGLLAALAVALLAGGYATVRRVTV